MTFGQRNKTLSEVNASVETSLGKQPFIAKTTTYYDKELIFDAFKSRYYVFYLSLLVAVCTIALVAIISTIRCAVIMSVYDESFNVFTPILDAGLWYIYSIIAVRIFFAERSKLKKRINLNVELMDMCHQEIYVRENKIEIFESGKAERHLVLFYENIKTITETENYYIIETIGKEFIIADKSNAKGNLEHLSAVRLLKGKHKVRKIVKKSGDVTYNRQELLREKYKSFLISAITIASGCIALRASSVFMPPNTAIDVLTGFPSFYSSTCMLYFLPVPIYCLFYGVKNHIKDLSYELNVTAGVGITIFIILFNIAIASGIVAMAT